MKLTFAAPGLPETGVVAAFVLEDRELSASARALNDRLRGALVRAIEAGKFKGKKDQVLSLPAPVEGSYDRVVLVGVGKAAELDALRLQALGGQIYAGAGGRGGQGRRRRRRRAGGDGADAGGDGGGDGLRREAPRLPFRQVPDQGEGRGQAAAGAAHLPLRQPGPGEEAVRAPRRRSRPGVHFTRDLVSEPANVIYPASLAAEAERASRASASRSRCWASGR